MIDTRPARDLFVNRQSASLRFTLQILRQWGWADLKANLTIGAAYALQEHIPSGYVIPTRFVWWDDDGQACPVIFGEIFWVYVRCASYPCLLHPHSDNQHADAHGATWLTDADGNQYDRKEWWE